MLYRVKQFMQAITAKITEEEQLFIRRYLSVREQELFFRLRVYEQKHCVLVAKGMQAAYEGKEAQSEMIKLGLLHDIGKLAYPLNPIEKSIIVVLDKMTKGKIKKANALKMVKCYYEHAELGYALLKAEGQYDEAFLSCIRDHHSQAINSLPALLILKKHDDLS